MKIARRAQVNAEGDLWLQLPADKIGALRSRMRPEFGATFLILVITA